MAGVHCAIATFFAASLDSNSNPGKLVVHQSSIPASPSTPRRTKRKNHLRPKILKTLIKPYPDSTCPQLPQNPVIPNESIEPFFQPDPHLSSDSAELDTVKNIVIKEFATSSGSVRSSVSEVQIEEPTQVLEAQKSGLARFSAPDVVKIGLCLVGLFVVQTVCSVLFVGLSDNDDKDKSPSLKKDGNFGLHGRNVAGKFRTKGGAVVYIDEAAMEEKLSEIRKMAREARETEQQMLKESGEDIDDANGDNEDGVVFEKESSRVRSGIEKEVDGKLTNLRRRLSSKQENLRFLDVNVLNSKVGEDEMKMKMEKEQEPKEEDKLLMFKKKSKFRNGMKMLKEKPKGFQGQAGNGSSRRHANVDKESQMMRNETAGGKDGELVDRDEELGAQSSSSGISNSELLNKDDGNRPTTERQDNFHLQSGCQVSKSRIIDQDMTKRSKKRVIPLKNGGSSMDEVGNKFSTKSNKELQLAGESDIWWSKLPYVHAILLQKGSPSEGLQGFFKLRSPSARNQEQTSYTVTFEDIGDAKNFCYLLESFFKDLPNASIEIVPLSVKKIKEAVKSSTMRVIVVKKGQVKLYAGQPFSEVQMDLRRLME